MSFLDEMLSKPVDIYRRSEPAQEAIIPAKVLELAEAKENAPRAATAQPLTDAEVMKTLEMAVTLEAEADSGGYKFARYELRRLLTAANKAEHSGNKTGFDAVIRELKALIKRPEPP
jgi:hypothetical protein